MASKALTLRKKKNRKRFKVHGFLVRMASTAGKKILQRRRRKGRRKISV